MASPWHVDLLHGAGIQAGVVHAGGEASWRGVEVLHLVRHKAVAFQVECHVYCGVEVGTGVAGDEVGHQILLFAQLLVDALVFCLEILVHLVAALPHKGQDFVVHVFWGHLQLAGDVVLAQLPEKGPILFQHQVVESDAAANKDLLYAGKLPQPSQEGQVVAVVHLKMGTGLGTEAFPMDAGSGLRLLGTGILAEVGGGAAYIVDVALEIRLFGEKKSLPLQGFMAAGLDSLALMECDGAEGAGSKAATIAGEGKFYLLKSRHPHLAVFCGAVIDGMPAAGKGLLHHLVKFLLAQGQGGWLLNYEAGLVLFNQDVAGDGVGVLLLQQVGAGEFGPALRRIAGHLGKAWNPHRWLEPPVSVGAAWGQLCFPPGSPAGSPDATDFRHRLALRQGRRNFQQGSFSHAVNQEIRLGVQKDGVADSVGPVVVVGEPSKAGLYATDNDRYPLVCLPDFCRVGDEGPVGTFPGHASVGIGIGGAGLVVGSVVGHHGVHGPSSNEEGQPWPSQDHKVGAGLPVRLGNNAHGVALGLQQTAQEGSGKGGVVHVGVT